MIDKLGGRADRWALGRKRSDRPSEEWPKASRCRQCGRRFADSLLLGGVCIYCLESRHATLGAEAEPDKSSVEPARLDECYRILECPKDADNEDLRKHYYKQAKKIHPDAAPGTDLSDSELKRRTEQFQRLKEAYDAIVRERLKRAERTGVPDRGER